MVLLLMAALGSTDDAPAHCFSMPGSTHLKANTVEQDGRNHFKGSLLRSMFECSIFGWSRKRLELEQNVWDLEFKVGLRVQLCCELCVLGQALHPLSLRLPVRRVFNMQRFSDRVGVKKILGFPGCKESTCQHRRHRDMSLTPGSGRSSGGHGTHSSIACLEDPHGWRSLAGYSPGGCEE